ncbi:zona pellucida sperm-binding protein 1 [Rhynchocyon petersi]
MAWSPYAFLLLTAATLGWGVGRQPQPEPHLPSLQHSYECGVQGMQLLVLPGPGQDIRFKVVDEFGNEFDVNNCSICSHWITFKPQGAVIFSADYKGCHMLEKDGRSQLKVIMEAVLPDGQVYATQDATLICPKTETSWTPDSQLVPLTMSSLSTPNTLSFQSTSSHPTLPHLSPGSGHAPSSLPHPSPGSGHAPSSLPHPSPGSGHAPSSLPHPSPGSGHALSSLPHPSPGSGHALSSLPHPSPGSGHALSSLPHPSPGSGHALSSLPHPSPGSGHPSPGSGHPSPGSGHPSPGSGHASPGSGHASPGSGHASPGSGHASPGSGHASPGSGHASPGSGHAPSSLPHPSPGSGHALSSLPHPSPGSGHALLSRLYPSYSVHPTYPTPTSSSLGPAPIDPTQVRSPQITVNPEDTDYPAFIGTNLTPEQCRVASGHVPCVVRSTSKEACQRAGCCYDNTRAVPCYYGNTVTAQCFRDGHVILVVSQETALAHRITLANIRLAYAPTSSCPPAQKTAAFVVFRFPLAHCGTTVQVAGNQLVYRNQLVSDLDIRVGPRGSVTWDSSFRFQVRCIFNASDFLPIQASVFPAPRLRPINLPGQLRLELRIAKDQTFSSYYREDDYPISRLLREPVHVEVRLLQRTDPRLALVLHQCWATPGSNPVQQPQWPILSDGCPFDGDGYRTQMKAVDEALPFPSHHQRFTVATFAFLDKSSRKALRGPVYIFCSASACYPSGPETCLTTCDPGTARRRRFLGDEDPAKPQDMASSPGTVTFEDSSELEPTLGPTGSSSKSNPQLFLWVVLLLPTVALVLAFGIFTGLRQDWAQKLHEGSQG